MSVKVASSAELLDALKKATGGETIELAPGAYDGVLIRNLDFATPVLITSADPADPAVFAGRVLIRDSGGLSFRHVDFQAADTQGGSSYAQLHIQGSERISVAEAAIAGRVAGEGEGVILEDIARGAPVGHELVEGHAAGYGLFVRDSSDVTLDRLDVSLVRTGLAISGADRVTLADSTFHDIRRDGVTITEAGDIRIADNLFHSFHPLELAAAPKAKDHADFIQYWGSGGTRGIDGLEISGNAFLQGAGGSMQGIFGRLANRDAGPDLQFRNFSIHDNVVNVSHLHGITVSDVVGLEIRDNTVLAAPLDPTALRWSGGLPVIRVTSERTTAAAMGGREEAVAPRDVTVSGNLVVGRADETVRVQTIDPADYADRGVVISDNVSRASLAGADGTDLLTQALTDLAAVTGLRIGGAAPLKDWIVAAAAEIEVTRPGQVFGTEGADALDASPLAGVDTSRIFAGGGDDLIRGGDGRDSILGGAGSDTMSGGARGDSFFLTASRDAAPETDVIADFDFAEGDAIILSANFPTRFFRDGADSANRLNVEDSGRVAVLNGEADLAELALDQRIDLVEAGEWREIRFDFDGDSIVDYTVRFSASGVVETGGGTEPTDPGGDMEGEPDPAPDPEPTEGEGDGGGGDEGPDDPEEAALHAPDFEAGETLLFEGFPAGFFSDLGLAAPAGAADGSAVLVASWRDVATLASMEGVEARALPGGAVELAFGPGLPAASGIVVQVGGLSPTEAAKLVSDLSGAVLRTDEAGLQKVSAHSADDTIFGLGGDDEIRGNKGDDWLHGGLGDDKLVGGAGSDTVYGGEGRDRFVITAKQMDAGDRDLFADVDFAAGDAVYLAGFRSGAFAGGWSDGGALLIRSVDDLVRLSTQPGFSLEAAGAGGVTLAIETARGPSFVELQLAPGPEATDLPLG